MCAFDGVGLTQFSSLQSPHRRYRYKRNVRVLKKLKRAASWASKAEALCAERGDERTSTEAEAFARVVKGNLSMEENDQTAALEHFLRARALYEDLGRASPNDQALFRETLSDLEPTILFCKYQIQRRRGKDANPNEATEALEALKQAQAQASLQPHLQSQVASLVSDADERARARIREVTWRGHTFDVPSDRLFGPTGDAFAAMDKLAESKNGASEGKEGKGAPSLETTLAAYGAVFTAFDSIKQVLQSEKADAASGGASAMSTASAEARTRMLAFERAISGLMLDHTIAQSLLLIQSRFAAYVPCNGPPLASLKGAGGSGGKEGGRDAAWSRTPPQEMIRLHELLKMKVADLAEVAEGKAAPGVGGEEHAGEEDEALYEQCAVATQAIKASLCFFLAEQYSASRQDAQAYLLYNRTVEYVDALPSSSSQEMEGAGGGAGGVGGAGVDPLAQVAANAQEIAALARIGRCLTHAKALSREAAASDAPDGKEGMDGRDGRRGSNAQGPSAKLALASNLDVAGPFVGRPDRCLYPLPPPMQSIPCQPFLLDTAVEHIAYPAMEGAAAGHQGKAEAGQPAQAAFPSLGGLFSWGR